MLLVVEILGFVCSAILAILWILYPSQNWEPWICLSGGIGVFSELIRRFAPKFSSETDRTLDSNHGTNNIQWFQQNVHTAKLTELLPRALQIAKNLRCEELEHWIRLELYGYSKEGCMRDDEMVPEYRAVTGRWFDSHDNVLDISEYPDLSIVNEYRFRCSVGKLEELAAQQKMQNIADDYLIGLIRKNMGIVVTRFCFSPIEVKDVLHSIRNKLAEKASECIKTTPLGIRH